VGFKLWERKRERSKYRGKKERQASSLKMNVPSKESCNNPEVNRCETIQNKKGKRKLLTRRRDGLEKDISRKCLGGDNGRRAWTQCHLNSEQKRGGPNDRIWPNALVMITRLFKE